MASDFIYLKGKGSWIRPYTLSEWGKWSMQLHPDQESLDKLRELQAEGVKNTLSRDDDGWFTRIHRKGELNVKGSLRGQRPPFVWDGRKPLPDGLGFMHWDQSEPIGNGSDVVVKVEVYEHRIPGQPGKKAKALKWDGIRIDNPVPFDSKRDMTNNQQEASKEFATVPKQTW